jgi:hypothetical protein
MLRLKGEVGWHQMESAPLLLLRPHTLHAQVVPPRFDFQESDRLLRLQLI